MGEEANLQEQVKEGQERPDGAPPPEFPPPQQPPTPPPPPPPGPDFAAIFQQKKGTVRANLGKAANRIAEIEREVFGLDENRRAFQERIEEIDRRKADLDREHRNLTGQAEVWSQVYAILTLPGQPG
jgi:hypothetical protein